MRKSLYILFSTLPAFCFCKSLPTITLIQTNGTTLTGHIVSFTPSTDTLKVRTAKGFTRCSANSLTSENQQFAMCWLQDKNFQTDSKLKALFSYTQNSTSSNITGTITTSATRSRKKTKREGVIGTKTTTLCSYKVRLTNSSGTPFQNLFIDYRIFFTHRLTRGAIGKYQLAGSAERCLLDLDETWWIETTPFTKAIGYKSAPGIRWGGKPMGFSATVQGIWLRIRKKDANGNWIERIEEHGNLPPNRDRDEYQKLYKYPPLLEEDPVTP